MKKLLLVITISMISSLTSLHGCPTCVGRIDQESQPFFSDEFYQPNEQSMDDLYAQFVETPHAKINDTNQEDKS